MPTTFSCKPPPRAFPNLSFGEAETLFTATLKTFPEDCRVQRLETGDPGKVTFLVTRGYCVSKVSILQPHNVVLLLWEAILGKVTARHPETLLWLGTTTDLRLLRAGFNMKSQAQSIVPAVYCGPLCRPEISPVEMLQLFESLAVDLADMLSAWFPEAITGSQVLTRAGYPDGEQDTDAIRFDDLAREWTAPASPEDEARELAGAIRAMRHNADWAGIEARSGEAFAAGRGADNPRLRAQLCGDVSRALFMIGDDAGCVEAIRADFDALQALHDEGVVDNARLLAAEALLHLGEPEQALEWLDDPLLNNVRAPMLRAIAYEFTDNIPFAQKSADEFARRVGPDPYAARLHNYLRDNAPRT